MKRSTLQRTILTFFLVLAACFFLKANTIQAQAAEYVDMFNGHESQDIIKNGNYYFKYASNYKDVLMSTSKNGVYTVTGIPAFSTIFGNGKQAYYIYYNTLYQYNYATRERTFLKTLKASGDESFFISSIYKGKIYMTKSSFDKWKFWTYSFDLKTKKQKLLKSNCNIWNRYGKYVVSQDAYRTDVSAYPITLYKITSKGLSKIKTLTKNGRYESLIKGKLYYSVYNKVMTKVTLYRCDANGSHRKKIKTFTAKAGNGLILICKATNKYCIYQTDSTTYYRYTYATKKTKKTSTY